MPPWFMTLTDLVAFGRRLVNDQALPSVFVLTAHTEDEPEGLRFQLRWEGTPPQAGHTLMTLAAFHREGPLTVNQALGYLLEVATSGRLPVCNPNAESPFLAGRDELGWIPPRPT